MSDTSYTMSESDGGESAQNCTQYKVQYRSKSENSRYNGTPNYPYQTTNQFKGNWQVSSGKWIREENRSVCHPNPSLLYPYADLHASPSYCSGAAAGQRSKSVSDGMPKGMVAGKERDIPITQLNRRLGPIKKEPPVIEEPQPITRRGRNAVVVAHLAAQDAARPGQIEKEAEEAEKKKAKAKRFGGVSLSQVPESSGEETRNAESRIAVSLTIPKSIIVTQSEEDQTLMTASTSSSKNEQREYNGQFDKLSQTTHKSDGKSTKLSSSNSRKKVSAFASTPKTVIHTCDRKR